MKCRACDGDLPAEAKFCMMCGTPAGAGPAGGVFTLDDFKHFEKTAETSSARTCPRCEILMTTSGYGVLTVDECFACGGMWCTDENLEKMVAKFRARKEAVEGVPLNRQPAKFDLVEQVRYLRCPECTALMSRTNFGRISGVMIDRCPGHGVWMDGGEFEKITEFIQTGGLAKSVRRRMENLQAETRAAEHRLESLRRTSTRGGYWGPLTFWDIW